MPSNSLPDADFNLPEMKTKSPSCPSGRVHMYDLYEYQRSRSFIDLGPNHSDSMFLNFFFSITTWLIEAKFYVESPWDAGTKACSNYLGHMTKMATMPIYGKIFRKIFSGTKSLRPMTLKLGMQHRVLEYYEVCSNDAPWLTLTYFMARSNLVQHAFV